MTDLEKKSHPLLPADAEKECLIISFFCNHFFKVRYDKSYITLKLRKPSFKKRKKRKISVNCFVVMKFNKYLYA